MLEAILDKAVPWTSGTGNHGDIVVFCRGTLARSMPDLPFPSHASEEERITGEQRLLSALEEAGILARGQYYSFAEMQARELGVLRERGLLGRESAYEESLNVPGRGVFITNDQTLCVQINCADHVRITASAAGLDIEGVWSQLEQCDAALEPHVEYAYDDKWGYLTGSLDEVGTGLTLSAVLHLPAETMQSHQRSLADMAADLGHSLHGFFGPLNDPRGDLFELTHQGTLGRSEQELVFNLTNVTQQCIKQEQELRQRAMEESGFAVEDRVGRALGIARGARLLDFEEGLGVLSSIRLGVALDLLEGIRLATVNALLLDSQQAHIEMQTGKGADELALSMERADRFRVSFS